MLVSKNIYVSFSFLIFNEYIVSDDKIFKYTFPLVVVGFNNFNISQFINV